MLNTNEDITCTVLTQPGNYHFEGLCEDCDTHNLASLSLSQVESRYHAGRVNQNQFEAYMYVWALLSPAGSCAGWRETPSIPVVRRIARKLFHARSVPVPADLATTARVRLLDGSLAA